MQDLGDADEIEIESNVQLIVEGKDQVSFCQELLKHLGITGVQINDFGGVRQLRSFLGGFVVSNGFSRVERIGVIRDAEDSAENAFRSVQGALRNSGLPVPDWPDERAAGHPSASVLILPGAGRPGMLETLLCESLADEPVKQCIDEFFECVGEASIKNPDKARAFAYLTTTSEPRYSIGVSVLQGQWDLNHSAFDDVRRFLEELASGARTAGTVRAQPR